LRPSKGSASLAAYSGSFFQVLVGYRVLGPTTHLSKGDPVVSRFLSLFQVCVAIVSSLFPITMAAQMIDPKPIIQSPVHFDTSLPISAYPRGPRSRRQFVHPRHRVELPPGAPVDGPDPVLQQSADQSSVTTAAAPAFGVNFDGVGVGFGTYVPATLPADANIAVGPNHVVQVVNVDFAVFDKSGRVVAGYPKSNSTIWTGFGGPCEDPASHQGDPIVQYDRLADRWIFTQFANAAFGPPFYQCFAVSAGPDPNGLYHRYAYTFGLFNDYAKLGVWPTGYLVSYNFWTSASREDAEFQVTWACAYDRNSMLVGAAGRSICFVIDNTKSVDNRNRNLLPSDLDGSNPPPSGSPGYFLNFWLNVFRWDLRLWKVWPNWTNPIDSQFTFDPRHIEVASLSPACGFGSCIPQLGTSFRLDSQGDKLMYRLAYRNFGTHESLVVNQSVTASTGVGVRWYEIRSPNGTPTVYQQGTYAPDTRYRWMGSIAMDKSRNMGLGYSLSSSGMYPAIAITSREPTDPLGTMKPETILIQGTGAQDGYTPTPGNDDRWGDYTAMRIDPSDDCTFWYTNEYYKKTNSLGDWSTRIGSFRIRSCPVPPDLFAIKKFQTGTGKVEVHVLSGASTPYQTWSLNVGTALDQLGDTARFEFALGDYNGDGSSDLFAVKKFQTGTGKVEVHVLSAASNYQSWLLNVGTALDQLSDPAMFEFAVGNYNNDGVPDLFAIKKFQTGTRKLEVHVLSGASNYQSWLLNVGTALDQLADTDMFEFALGDYNRDGRPDLFAIKKFQTGTGKVEVHVLSAATNYQSWLLNIGTLVDQLSDPSMFDFVVGDYNRDTKPDVFAIKKFQTGTGTTEVHVLSGATNYQTWLLQTGTALDQISDPTMFGFAME
jgi:hypothetical protein